MFMNDWHQKSIKCKKGVKRMDTTYIIKEIYLTKKMEDASLSEKERKLARNELKALQKSLNKKEVNLN